MKNFDFYLPIEHCLSAGVKQFQFSCSNILNFTVRDRIFISHCLQSDEVDGNKIPKILPDELLPFSLPLLPCLWVYSGTSLSTRPPANYRCPRLRLRAVLHHAENSLPDLSSWYSSDAIFNLCFLVIKSTDSQLWARPSDLLGLLALIPLSFHVKNHSEKPPQSGNTTTERLGKRRARASALIGGIVTTIVSVSPNKDALLFESIRSQNGANKRQRCAIIVSFHPVRKAITIILKNRIGHFVFRIIFFVLRN